jgi:predicted dehydrogenase
MSKKKVKFAVVGVGRMGRTHAFLLSRGLIKDAELAAVADISRDALNAAKKVCGHDLRCFDSYRELLDGAEFDAVIVAVPHYFHIEIAKFFIERGKHVLIEKPVSVTVGEAAEFNEFLKEYDANISNPLKSGLESGVEAYKNGEKADKNADIYISNPQKEREENGAELSIKKEFPKKRVSVAVMYNQRTNPVYKKAKALLDGGALGEIRRINFIVTDWYRSDAYYKNNSWRATWSGEGGGLLINQCVHQLDILHWLVGMPESICARALTKGRNIAAENEVTAVLRYKDGVFCSLSASGRELHGENRIEIAGSRGRLIIGKYSMKFVFWNPSETEVNAKTVKGYGRVKKRTRRYFYGPRLIADGILGQQRRITANFVGNILRNEKLVSPAQEGIYALMLINGIYLSAWEGKEVELPFDTERYAALLKERADAEKVVDDKN